MAFSNFLSMLQSLISARHLNGEQLRSEVVQPLVSPSAPTSDIIVGLLSRTAAAAEEEQVLQEQKEQSSGNNDIRI